MKTLVSYLNERTPQELRLIAKAWDVNLTERLFGGNTFELAEQMNSEYRQRRMVETLSVEQIKLLDTLLVAPNFTATYQELAEKFNSDLNQASAIAVKLREKGLVYPDVARADAGHSFLPASLDEELKQKLNTLSWGRSGRRSQSPATVPALTVPRELARPLQRLLGEKKAVYSSKSGQIGLKPTQLPLLHLLKRLEPDKVTQEAETWEVAGLLGEAKGSELVEELANSITDAATQKQVLAGLDADCRELFENLKKNNHPVTIQDLLKTYVSNRRLERSLAPLTRSFLAWETFEDGKSLVWVPQEVAHPKNNVKKTSQIALQTLPEPPDVNHAPPFALAWDILNLLVYFRQNEVMLTQNAEFPKRHQKKIMARLWHYKADEERFDFLINLCRRLEMIAFEYDTERLLPGSIVAEWLNLSLYEQMYKLVHAFRNSLQPYTLALPFYYSGEANRGKAITAIFGLMSDFEPGIWYSFESLITKIEHEQPFFIRSRREMLNQFGPHRLQEMTKQWRLVEGNFIRMLFAGPLDWLGIVRTGFDESGKLASFSLTPFGQTVVSSDKPNVSLPETDKPLTVLANFEIMLFVPQTKILWNLFSFSDNIKLDNVSQFSLNRKSVLRALDNGFTPTAIIEWLKEKSAQPLSQNLIVSIQDWGKDYKQVQINRTVLLEVEDPAILDEIINSKTFSAYIQKRLTPTAAVVNIPDVDDYSRSDPLKSFKTKLKNGGYFIR